MKKIMLFLILGIFLISFVNANSQTFISCGGDAETIFVCDIGGDAQTTFFGGEPEVEVGRQIIEKGQVGVILAIAGFMIFFVVMVIFFIKQRKKKNVSEY